MRKLLRAQMDLFVLTRDGTAGSQSTANHLEAAIADRERRLLWSLVAAPQRPPSLQ
jgi:hypothetical protein